MKKLLDYRTKLHLRVVSVLYMLVLTLFIFHASLGLAFWQQWVVVGALFGVGLLFRRTMLYHRTQQAPIGNWQQLAVFAVLLVTVAILGYVLVTQ